MHHALSGGSLSSLNEPGLAALRMPVMDTLVVLLTVPEDELVPDDEFGFDKPLPAASDVARYESSSGSELASESAMRCVKESTTMTFRPSTTNTSPVTVSS